MVKSIKAYFWPTRQNNSKKVGAKKYIKFLFSIFPFFQVGVGTSYLIVILVSVQSPVNVVLTGIQ